MVALLFFTLATSEKKTTEPILAVIMLSKIQLDYNKTCVGHT